MVVNYSSIGTFYSGNCNDSIWHLGLLQLLYRLRAVSLLLENPYKGKTEGKTLNNMSVRAFCFVLRFSFRFT